MFLRRLPHRCGGGCRVWIGSGMVEKGASVGDRNPLRGSGIRWAATKASQMSESAQLKSGAEKRTSWPPAGVEAVETVEQMATPKDLLKVRRNDLKVVLRAAKVRIMNWSMDYFYKFQDERALHITETIRALKTDVVVLHNVAPVKDKEAKKSVYEILRSELIDTKEYDLVVDPEILDKFRYGFSAILVRNETIEEVRNTEYINCTRPTEAAYQLSTHISVKTKGGPVPLCVMTSKFDEIYQYGPYRSGAELKLANNTMMETPMPCVYLILGRSGQITKYVRSYKQEKGNMYRKLSDAFIKVGVPNAFRYNYDVDKNNNIQKRPVSVSFGSDQKGRVLRSYVFPGSCPEMYRPIVHNYFHVGTSAIKDVDVHASFYFGVVTDVLVPIVQNEVSEEELARRQQLIDAGDRKKR